MHIYALWSFALCAGASNPCQSNDAVGGDACVHPSSIGASLLQKKLVAAEDAQIFDEDGAGAMDQTLDESEELGRGSFSQTCVVAPGKRLVLVTVSCEYVHMFQNWLHYAKQFLQTTEQLLVIAEDESGKMALQKLLDNLADPVPPFTLSGPAPSGTSLISYPFNSVEFNALTHKRSSYILHLLRQNCTVLYSDVDTVWLHDPFLDIAAAGSGDLMVTEDGHPEYYCTCFLHWHPTKGTLAFVQRWIDACAARPNEIEQAAFNAVLKSPAAEAFEHKVLPGLKYPSGHDTWVGIVSARDPSWIHANYIVGLSAKTDFLRASSLWQEPFDVSCD